MITIIGPGGVGGLLAGLLIRAGVETTVVGRTATVERLRRNGLRIVSNRYGEFSVPVSATTQIPEGSHILVAVKSYGLAEVLPQIAAAKPVSVLSVLNGLAHTAGFHKVLSPVTDAVCGTVRVVTVRDKPGVIRHSSDYLEVALPKSAADWPLGEALEAGGVDVIRGGSEATVLWRKFHFLAAMALLTAWADEPMGPALVLDPTVTGSFLAELAALATAEGFSVSAEDLVVKLAAVSPAATSSFRTDVRAGGPTEIDSLGFDLLRRAANHGLLIPTITRVVGDIAARLSVAKTGGDESVIGGTPSNLG